MDVELVLSLLGFGKIVYRDWRNKHPSIPFLYFAQARDELIIPYLNRQGINPVKLKYDRAKNAPVTTKIIEASTIKGRLKVRGELFNTVNGNRLGMQ